MVGGQETGNETYIKGLVDGLKAVGDELELILYYAKNRCEVASQETASPGQEQPRPR
jgi:hypothetical protein